MKYRMIICALWCITIQSFNRSLFFRSSSFWGEPRLEKPWLSTLDIQLQGGSNHRGNNGCGKKRNILSIYGPECVEALSAASPGIPLVLPGNPKTICFQAVADVFEADFTLTQNLCHGFFMQAHIPVILLQVHPSGYRQDGACDKKQPKDYCPVWQQSLQALQPFLDQFKLRLHAQRQAALSDATLFAGWTHSFCNTTYLDFIDFTVKTGVLFPSGKKQNPHEVFSIPYGYNGHWAIPLWGDLSIGAFDWLTVGFHGDGLFFFDKTTCIRMKTPKEASTGLIVLGEGLAKVDRGSVWRVGPYIKADHFFNGLSLLVGFTYEQQNRTHLRPMRKSLFDTQIVNRDARLLSWNRSIMHLLAEYDFIGETSTVGPRISIFYDRQLTGKRVFNISMVGGYFGIDINWCF